MKSVLRFNKTLSTKTGGRPDLACQLQFANPSFLQEEISSIFVNRFLKILKHELPRKYIISLFLCGMESIA